MWKNGIALVLGILLSCIIGEVVTRVYVFGWDAFSYREIQSFDNLLRSGLVQISDIDGLECELTPNNERYFKFASFSTNEHGQRDQSYKKAKDKNTHRIAIIGDSFTMGSGVEHEDIYHTIVERKLNHATDTISYELLNFGVAGYNLTKYVIQLKEKAVHFMPDEVVIGFCGYNDHYLPGLSPKLDSIPPNLKPQGFWAFYLKKLIMHGTIYKYDPRVTTYDDENLQFIEDRFTEIKNFCNAKGIKVSVIYLSNIYKPKEAKQIRRISERVGFKFADTSRLFKGGDLANYSLNAFDQHPNKEANALFANVLQGLLTSN